ncbi:MAG: hypothetical protein AAGK97_06510 [Bacteroidota bacterium]
MQSFSLAYYLNNLNELEGLEITDLTKLVAKYPYCQLLHALLIRKLNEHKLHQSKKALGKFSFFTKPLSKIYNIIFKKDVVIPIEADTSPEKVAGHSIDLDIPEAPVQKPNKEIQEVNLAIAQLKINPPSKVEKITSSMPIGKRMKKMLKNYNLKPSAINEEEYFMENQEKIEEKQFDQNIENRYDKGPVSQFVSWLKKFNKPEIGKSEDITYIERPKSNPILNTHSNDNQALEKENPVKKKKKKKKKSNSESKGLVINEEIYSETLADLLADQGHDAKAIKMYERLSLIFPEKSTLFAVKIEKIKRKSE